MESAMITSDAESLDFSTCTVLIAEDDRIMQRYLDAQLSPLGMSILHASNGAEAIEKIRSHRPDLVLMDVVMPGMDGFEACRAIKEDPAIRDTVVVHLTSLGRDAKDRSFDSGADDFLTKPPHVVELRTRVRAHLMLKRLQDHVTEEQSLAPTPVWDTERPARVLVVASHEQLLDHVAQELGALGQEVRTATSIAEATPLLGTGLVDVLVLDHHLQDGNGLHLASQLRNARRTRNLPILLLVARQNLESEIRDTDSGPSDLLVKPFLPQELRLRLGVLLRQARAREGRGVAAKDLRLSLTDALTGAFTAAFLQSHLDLVLQGGGRVAVAAYHGAHGDRDWQKSYEEMAKDVALLRAQTRPGDAICRVADHTFVLLLAGRSTQELQQWLDAFGRSGARGTVAGLMAEAGHDAQQILWALADNLRKGTPAP